MQIIDSKFVKQKAYYEGMNPSTYSIQYDHKDNFFFYSADVKIIQQSYDLLRFQRMALEQERYNR